MATPVQTADVFAFPQPPDEALEFPATLARGWAGELVFELPVPPTLPAVQYYFDTANPANNGNLYELPLPPTLGFRTAIPDLETKADVFQLPLPPTLAYLTQTRSAGTYGTNALPPPLPVVYTMRGLLVAPPNSVVQWPSVGASDPTGALAPAPVNNIVVLRVGYGKE